jgi:alanyl-tRNA synthetase
MRLERGEDGGLVPLQQVSVDTGMGLERLVSVLQGRRSVYETDEFEPWMRILPTLWDLDERSLRIVSDHLRSSIVVIGEGVRPSNTGRGYVVRRLIRRVLTVLRRGDDSRSLCDLPVELVGGGSVRGVLLEEERRFTQLLERGRRVLSRPEFRGVLGDEDYRYLHDTYGLPRELVVGLLR